MRTVTKVTSVAVVVVAGLCSAVLLQGASGTVAAPIKVLPIRDQHCEYQQGATFCQLGARVEPTWLILGDLYAYRVVSSLDDWLIRTGQSARFAFLDKCLPLRGVEIFEGDWTCSDMNADAARLLAEGAIKNVLLVSDWSEVADGLVTLERDRKLDVEGSAALFRRQVESTLVEMHGYGAKVYTWGLDMPEVDGVFAPEADLTAALVGRFP
jgi:hypothetical protein